MDRYELLGASVTECVFTDSSDQNVCSLDDLYQPPRASVDDHYLFNGDLEGSFGDFGLPKLLCVLQLYSDATIILMHALHRPVAVLDGDERGRS